MSKNWNNEVPSSIPTDNKNNNSTSQNTSTSFDFPMISEDHGGFSQSSATTGGRSLFPAKLRQILDDSEVEGNQSIVSWLPHGRAFRVHKPKEFAAKIVGRYFNHGQYRSFTRQLYHYGFGKVDSGEDMGAFFHPQFLRDKPALAFLIGRRKDNKKKPDEQGTAEAEKKTSSIENSLLSEHTSPRGFGMLESPFQALENDTTLRIDDGSIGLGKDRGMSGLLNQLSSEDQEAMIRHFKSDKGGPITTAKIQPRGNNSSSQNFAFDEEAGIGLLFGDDDPKDEGTSKISLQQTATSRGGSSSSPQQERDWFSSIGNFFDDNSFEDDMFGVDFEPRPIEEMILLSYNLRRNTNQR